MSEEMKDNVHELKPYPFHAWVAARIALMNLFPLRADKEKIQEFFLQHVTEYGQSIVEHMSDRERYKDNQKELDKIAEYRTRQAIHNIAEEIYRTGAYCEEIFYDPTYHSRTKRTNIRVLVLNFEKIMGPVNLGDA